VKAEGNSMHIGVYNLCIDGCLVVVWNVGHLFFIISGDGLPRLFN